MSATASSQVPNVNAMLQAAHQEGSLSAASLQILTSIPDLGVQIGSALGVPAVQVDSTEVVLVSQLIDDSGSIRFAGNSQVVRDGHNLVLDSLDGSKQKSGILVRTEYLNGLILCPFSLLEQAVRMDTHNYDPGLGTPLYDRSIVFLGAIPVKAKEFADTNGVPVRTVSLIVTDGHDEHSIRHTAADVATIVHDLLMQETHIVAAMGIDDGGRTDFRKVFAEMGIPDQWILTPGNSQKEIRAAFQTFSQSAVRASQSAKSFSKTAAGGFATN